MMETGRVGKGINLPARLLLPVEGDAGVPALVQVRMLGGGSRRVLEVATALGANDLTGDLVCRLLHLEASRCPRLCTDSVDTGHFQALSMDSEYYCPGSLRNCHRKMASDILVYWTR